MEDLSAWLLQSKNEFVRIHYITCHILFPFYCLCLVCFILCLEDLFLIVIHRLHPPFLLPTFIKHRENETAKKKAAFREIGKDFFSKKLLYKIKCSVCLYKHRLNMVKYTVCL